MKQRSAGEVRASRQHLPAEAPNKTCPFFVSWVRWLDNCLGRQTDNQWALRPKVVPIPRYWLSKAVRKAIEERQDVAREFGAKVDIDAPMDEAATGLFRMLKGKINSTPMHMAGEVGDSIKVLLEAKQPGRANLRANADVKDGFMPNLSVMIVDKETPLRILASNAQTKEYRGEFQGGGWDMRLSLPAVVVRTGDRLVFECLRYRRAERGPEAQPVPPAAGRLVSAPYKAQPWPLSHVPVDGKKP